MCDFALSTPPGPLHRVYVASILSKLEGKSDLNKVCFMLSVEVVDIIERVADFLGSVVRR